jgi:5'-3' exonuclease
MDIMSPLNNVFDAYESAGVSIILVFDGARSPAKSDLDAVRRQDYQDGMDELKELYEAADKDDLARVNALRKNTHFVREDIVALVLELAKKRDIKTRSAAFEADQELVAMEMDGEIDAIATEDSDLFYAGARTLVMNQTLNRPPRADVTSSAAGRATSTTTSPTTPTTTCGCLQS